MEWVEPGHGFGRLLGQVAWAACPAGVFGFFAVWKGGSFREVAGSGGNAGGETVGGGRQRPGREGVPGPAERERGGWGKRGDIRGRRVIKKKKNTNCRSVHDDQ